MTAGPGVGSDGGAIVSVVVVVIVVAVAVAAVVDIVVIEEIVESLEVDVGAASVEGRVEFPGCDWCGGG